MFRRKKPEPVENEKVSVDEIDSWLEGKKEEIEKEQGRFLQPVRERISKLTQDLEENTSVLKKVNVDEKKAEQKIKLIVKENLDNYIYHVENLIKELKEIEKEKELVERVNSVFDNFQKKSKASYEKATFLIGKEIASIKENIRSFFRDLDRILKENKELAEKSKIISPVEERVRKFGSIKKIKEEAEKNIQDYNDKIRALEKEIEIREGKIEEIKNSEKFLQQEKEKQELEETRVEIEQEIGRLRERIDFKFLANFFHSFEKEMARVKEYKENFKENFLKDSEGLLSLIQESKMPGVEIVEKIEEIKGKKKEVEEKVFDKTGIEELEREMKRISSQKEILNSKKARELKRQGKVEKNLNETIDALKEELIKINVEVV